MPPVSTSRGGVDPHTGIIAHRFDGVPGNAAVSYRILRDLVPEFTLAADPNRDRLSIQAVAREARPFLFGRSAAWNSLQLLSLPTRCERNWHGFCFAKRADNTFTVGVCDMHKRSTKSIKAPLMTCHATTAAALGAVLLRHPNDALRFGPAFIAVRGHDGSCWAWPLEKAFVAAIERR